MTEANFFTREFPLSCICCLHWFSGLATKPTLIISLVVCFGALSCPQTLAQEIEVKAESALKSEPAEAPSKLFIEADTPEQIAAMAQLYDVDEPINYIDFLEMAQHPVGPRRSLPTKQSPWLLWLLLAFILGAILSLMVYMLFNRSIETAKDEKQDDDKPVFPRMRRIAFIACLLFSICIVAIGLLLIVQTIPWTLNNSAQQSAATQSPAGPITWAYWHPGKVVQQLNQNKIVWVSYTADWDPTSKLNEARVAANNELLQRMNKMNVSFVAVDFTAKNESNYDELARTGSFATPVNFIYPPNYPEEPAIKLETLITLTDVDLVLDRMEAIVSKLKAKEKE